MISPWLAAAALTFAASLHCVGMCGGFVLVMASARRRAWSTLAGHLQFQLGKATTYAFLGTLAGAFGELLLRQAAFTWSARALALLAGLALLAAGLNLLGLLGRRAGAMADWAGSLWARALGPLLSSRPAGASLVAGLIVGLLPCPMVYAGLAAAAATGSALAGALTMAGVALGTLPALGLVALTGSVATVNLRRGLARAAGVLLVLVGVLTLARAGGLHAGHSHHAGPAPAAAPCAHGAHP